MGKRKVEQSTEISELIEKGKHDRYLLFEGYYLPDDGETPPIISTSLIKYSDWISSSPEDVYEEFMGLPFTVDCSQYCITDIDYSLGYTIKYTVEKWYWSVDLIIENGDEFHLPVQSFTRNGGSEETEELAIQKAQECLHTVIEEILEMESHVVDV